METNRNIEDQVNAALQAAKNIQPAELTFGFSDRVMNRVHTKSNVRWLYNVSPLLRVAAVFVIIIINMLTLKLAFTTQPAPSAPQYISFKDFVNDYQINDGSEELLTTNNTPVHEQP